MTTHVTTLVLHVDDEPGVLNRIASVVRRRGFNINSVSVGGSEVPGLSRMTLVIDGATAAARRLEAHLSKLVQVRHVEDLTHVPSVCRDLAMIKVAADPASRGHIMQLVDVFRARIVDVAPDSLVVEITGTEDKVDGLLGMLRPYGVLEVARTGRVTMARGAAANDRARPIGMRRLSEPSANSEIACSV
jgi:acetolactate synthase-1/3 small subunit